MKKTATRYLFLFKTALFFCFLWAFNLPAIAQTQYCTTGLYTDGCSANDRIDFFSLGTFSNPTTTCSPDGYSDYTNLSVTVNRTDSYPLQIRSAQGFPQGFSVWIDFNQDGDFDDSGERVVNSGVTTTVLNATITIPQTAAVGATRLRVRSLRAAVPGSTAACAQFNYGETEDYTITISPSTQYCETDLYYNGCTPSYAISRVQFNTIDKTDANCSWYTNHTAINTNVEIGSTYQLKVTDAGSQVGIGAWIDYNHDYDFDDPGEFIVAGPRSTNLHQTNVIIPQTALPGPARLRVRATDGVTLLAGESCTRLMRGETKDFTVNILPASGPIDAGITGFYSPLSACGMGAAESVKITLKNFGTSDLYNVPLSFTVNGNPVGNGIFTDTLAPGASAGFSFTTTANLALAGTYKIKATAGLTGDTKTTNDTLTITVQNGGSGISVFPYTENFSTFTEEVIGSTINPGTMMNGWGNQPRNDVDWIVSGANTRQRRNYGPQVDHTTGTAAGIYMAMTNVSPAAGSVGAFLSPCLNFASVTAPNLEFWYHMFGTSLGTLAVDVNADGIWTMNVFTLTGQQQTQRADAWRKAQVSLLQFAGKTVRLRFRGVTGTSSSAAIAIDDIRLFDLKDIGVSAVMSPLSGCDLGSQPVCVQVMNYSQAPQANFPISYRVNNLPVVTETFTDTIAPGGSTQFCFTALANMTNTGTYSLKAYTAAGTDQNRANDTTKVTIIKSVPNLTFSFTVISPTGFLFTTQNLSLTAPVKWYFGDGDSAMTASPTHIYPAPGTYTIILKGTDQQGCVATVQQTITILSTGLREHTEKTFKLYPNPAASTVTLKFSEKKSAKEVEIVSVLGQKVKVQQIAAGSEEVRLNVEQLPAGTYLIRITDAERMYIKPLIVQR